MVASFVIAPIVGILLALRFKVFVLVPATLLAAVAIIASGHQPKVTLALTLLGTVVLLQIGYLVGLIVRAHLQRETTPRPGYSVSTSIVRFSTWRAAGTSKRPATAKAVKRHLVE